MKLVHENFRDFRTLEEKLGMNSVAGQVELVGLTVARGPQPHSIVTNNIVTHKGSAVTEATNLAQSPLFFSNQN